MENVFAAFAVAPLGGALLVAVVGFLFALVVGSGDIDRQCRRVGIHRDRHRGLCGGRRPGHSRFFLFRRLRWIRGAHWVLLAPWSAPSPAHRAGRGDEDGRHGGGILGPSRLFLAAGAVIGPASGFLFARTIAVSPPRPDIDGDIRPARST